MKDEVFHKEGEPLQQLLLNMFLFRYGDYLGNRCSKIRQKATDTGDKAAGIFDGRFRTEFLEDMKQEEKDFEAKGGSSCHGDLLFPKVCIVLVELDVVVGSFFVVVTQVAYKFDLFYWCSCRFLALRRLLVHRIISRPCSPPFADSSYLALAVIPFYSRLMSSLPTRDPMPPND